MSEEHQKVHSSPNLVERLGHTRDTSLSMKRSDRLQGGLQVDVAYNDPNGEQHAYQVHLPPETPRFNLDLDSGRMQLMDEQGNKVDELNIYNNELGGNQNE